MDTTKLQNKLLSAARMSPVDDRVPYAFEKRVLAALAGRPPQDGWTWWSACLWRAVAPCLAITLLLGVWAIYSSADSRSTEGLAGDLESTVMAAVDSDGASW